MGNPGKAHHQDRSHPDGKLACLGGPLVMSGYRNVVIFGAVIAIARLTTSGSLLCGAGGRPSSAPSRCTAVRQA